MSDLIDRQEAIDALAKFVPYSICDESEKSYMNGLTDAYNLICQLPSVEPKKGRWVDIVEMDSGGYPFKVGVCCSVCGFETLSEDNYCPCCGVKMSEIPTDSESEDKE